MEYKSMGQLIQTLRKEKGLTQKQLAEMLNITDKAVSKWERDVACPDTATLPRLAEILGIPVDSLLSAKTTAIQADSTIDANNDINPDAEMYKKRTKELLLLGMPGFIIGFVLFIIIFFKMPTVQEKGVTVEAIIVGFIMAFLGGYIFAGIPYGWRLCNEFLGRWNIFGNIFVMLFLFVFKIGLAYCIGLFAYPIALVYNLIRSQKSRRKVKIWTIIVISIVVLWHVCIGVYAVIDEMQSRKKDSTAQSKVVQTVDVDTFLQRPELLDELSESALSVSKEKENELVEAYGTDIAEPSRVHGVFYCEAKNPNDPPYLILKKLYVSNAVVVVTGFFLEGDDKTIDEWRMLVTAYPNFSFSKDGELSYREDKVYTASLSVDDMAELRTWFYDEYSDMYISEIELP